jgi:ligand-binding sensor domain-containing protein/signal transduction histidine kinase/DNA-binding response OmpR family regulator
MKLKSKKFFSILCIITLAVSTFAQPKFQFTHFSITDGISNGVVRKFAQDSLGFLWIGTNDGLNRFDGVRFKVYQHNPNDSNSIVSSSVRSILPDGNNLWLGTNIGIDLLDLKTEKFTHFPIINKTYKGNGYSIEHIYKDQKKNILINTNKGTFIFDKKKKIFTKFILGLPQHPVNYTNTTYIRQDREQNYWIGTNEIGLYKYEKKSGKIIEITDIENGENTFKGNKIIHIYEDNENQTWVSTEKGVYKISNKTGNIVHYTQKNTNGGLPHTTINAVTEDYYKNLLFATNGGLSIYNRKTDKFTSIIHQDNDETSIANNSIHAIFIDNQRNLWIGSGEDGLSVSKSQSIDFFNIKKSNSSSPRLNYAYVLSVIEDSYQNIWIGTNGGGINLYNNKTKNMKYIFPPTGDPAGRDQGAIMSLMEDNTGNIWIGTYLGGAIKFNPKSNKYTFIYNNNKEKDISKNLPNNVINSFYQDRKNNIWIATNGGLSCYDPKTEKLKHYTTENTNGSLISNYVTYVIEDSYGTLWVGTFNGLCTLNASTGKFQTFSKEKTNNTITSNSIYCIYEDSKKRIWLASEYGLHLYNRKEGTFSSFTTINGLPSNAIKGILQDNRGYLWLSTSKGLSRFDTETLQFINYTLQDGIISTDFFRNACYRSKSGWLYFGGDKGLTYFNPDKITKVKRNLPLLITGLYLYNKEVMPGDETNILKQSISQTDEISLNYNQSFISIEYATLNLSDPSKDSYSYKLEGIDRQWNNIGNKRVATYTNLPPGTYKFIVKYKNDNGAESQKSLLITIRPPFWKSPISYFIYLLIISGILYVIYSNIKSRNLYRQNIFKERLEKEKAIELNQDKIKFFINVSHEFKTPLTLIISPLEKLISSNNVLSNDERNNLYHLIYRNTQRLSRLINQIMDLRKIDTGNLQLLASKNEVCGFVKELALNFEDHAKMHNIDYKILTPKESFYAWFDLDKIEKVVYNLLSNAFRYTSDGKSISINLEKTEENQLTDNDKKSYPHGYLTISVKDTGKGIAEDQLNHIFTRFYQINTETLANPACSGVGLSIAKEFIEMHQGEINVESELKKGSTFSIRIPLGKEHLREEFIAQNTDFEFNIDETQIKPNEEEQLQTQSEPEQSKKKYKIVLAEDNHELRNFLCNNLKSNYTVYDASDGRQALSLVTEHMPDLIISDVMMPHMNGYELLKAVKTDVKTSHIPVIILTVLNSVHNQIEGFEIGADDYITKPFNLPLLQTRIFTIIENRKKLVKRFLNDNKISSEHFSANVLDEKFIAKAIAIIEKNLTNPELTAEQFSEEIGMSRSNLHVKLKSLTGQSATEFIRTIKLKKSITLLSTCQYNISEVAYMVGFNNISYFNRCFKSLYGITPGEFMQSVKEGKDPNQITKNITISESESESEIA